MWNGPKQTVHRGRVVGVAIDPTRMIAHLHGHAGWLAAAALVHPAILLRTPTRRAHLSVLLATLTVTLAAAFGVTIYPLYSSRLRQAIFVSAPTIGWLFERKEHLAFGAVLLAWAGAAAYVAAWRADDALSGPLRAFAWRAFVAAAALAVAVAAIGTIVASYRSL
jgi:hypothetical protein